MDTQSFINENVITMLLKHIDPIAVLMVILGGIFSKKQLKEVTFIGNTWKTLIVGSIFISAYILVLYASGALHKEDYMKYFISYCVATTFYDLILKHVMNKVKGLSGTAKSLILLIAIGFASCTPAKKAQISSDITRYTQAAVEITAKIEKAVDDPRLEAITIFTPQQWDNQLRNQVRGFLSSALPYIGIAQNCKDAELEVLLRCIAVEMRNLPPEQHRQLLNKLSVLLAIAQQTNIEKKNYLKNIVGCRHDRFHAGAAIQTRKTIV